MYKSEIARAAGVDRRTLYRWLKADQDVLKTMNVSPHRHLLPARAVRYLNEKYDFL